MGNMRRILIVDDEPNMCEALRILLENDDYAVVTAADGEEAIRIIEEGEVIDLVISDLKMPGIDGMGVLKFLEQGNYDIPLVLITAYGTIEAAVDAMKKGAADFITKPFNKDAIRRVITRVFDMENLSEENRRLKELVHERELVCESPAMRRVMDTAGRIAAAPTAVLITGESGSGKGVVAQAIHRLGGDPERPFVAINCPTIPETLLESELFGYRRGAFTGADADFKGKVRLSEGGTLFLDEIAEIPLRIQAKLLRLLEEKQFEPLGSTSTVHINNRIICATNRDLAALVDSGAFRTDLYYRINTITLDIPPLRERPEDIIRLAELFLAKSAAEMQKRISGLAGEVTDALRAYHWPGNVRELRNVIERAVVLSQHRQIELSDLPAEVREAPGGAPSADTSGADGKLERWERGILEQTLARHGGNISAAARELQMSRSRLRYRLRKYGLSGA
jgi:DNA-binding NtrC family response regulator